MGQEQEATERRILPTISLLQNFVGALYLHHTVVKSSGAVVAELVATRKYWSGTLIPSWVSRRGPGRDKCCSLPNDLSLAPPWLAGRGEEV